MNNFLSSLFKKLKSIKHIEIILAILFGLILLMVYFSSSGTTDNSLRNNKNSFQTSSTDSDIIAYTNEIEGKLSNLLSKINGAGNVTVMVMLDEQTDLEATKLPNISSVVVVADGASNVWVKLEIVKAVQALLNLNTNNVEVLVGGSG